MQKWPCQAFETVHKEFIRANQAFLGPVFRLFPTKQTNWFLNFALGLGSRSNQTQSVGKVRHCDAESFENFNSLDRNFLAQTEIIVGIL